MEKIPSRPEYLRNLRSAVVSNGGMIARGLLDADPRPRTAVLHDNLAAIDRYLEHATTQPPTGYELTEPRRFSTISHDDTRFVGRRVRYGCSQGGEEASVVYICSGMGAPNTAMVVHELKAYGVKAVIKVGTASGLTSDLVAGDVVIPAIAIADEGTSKWNDHEYSLGLGAQEYFKGQRTYLADGRLRDQLKRLVLTRVDRVHAEPRTAIWSVDSYPTFIMCRDLYRQCNARNSSLPVAVEMECGALFSTAQMLELEVAALIVVSRSLEEMEAPALGVQRPRDTRHVRSAECECLAAATLAALSFGGGGNAAGPA